MESRIPVEDYARKYGFLTSEVLYKIRAGILDGEQIDGRWFVIPHSLRTRRPRTEGKPRGKRRHGVSIGRQNYRLSAFLRRWFAPRYDELTLLIMSTAFLWLATVNPGLRRGVMQVVYGSKEAGPTILFIIFIGGATFAIMHAFTRRGKSELERELMLFFAVALQAITAFMSAAHLLSEGNADVSLILPAWNLASGFMLTLLYRFDIVNTDSLIEGEAATSQSIIAIVVTLGLIALGNAVLDYHWTVTLAMSIAVASTISRVVDGVVVVVSQLGIGITRQ